MTTLRLTLASAFALSVLATNACRPADDSGVFAAENNDPIRVALTGMTAPGDAAQMLFATAPNATQMHYCVETAPGVCASQTPTVVPAFKIDIPARADVAFFKTTSLIPLAAGRAIYLTARDANNQVVANSVVRVNAPGAIPGTSPGTAAPALSGERNLELKVSKAAQALGQPATIHLGDLFTPGVEYLLVDFSGVGCGGCHQLHSMLQGERYKSIFERGKCRHVTIVDDIDGWHRRYSPNSDGGKTSFGSMSGAVGRPAKALGISLSVTPTVAIISRADNGKIVSEIGEGSIPSEFDQLCK